jgi:plasmid maintenance system antidote protein VapI
MAIHIGKKIKEELYKQNLSVTNFAKKINRTRNVVYNIFERESIDTDLLNKIGKVLNCDFFSVYSAQKEYSLDSVKSFNSREPEPQYGKHVEEMERLQQQNKALANEVLYLKKIISLLEDKKSGKEGKK